MFIFDISPLNANRTNEYRWCLLWYERGIAGRCEWMKPLCYATSTKAKWRLLGQMVGAHHGSHSRASNPRQRPRQKRRMAVSGTPTSGTTSIRISWSSSPEKFPGFHSDVNSIAPSEPGNLETVVKRKFVARASGIITINIGTIEQNLWYFLASPAGEGVQGGAAPL